MTDVDDTTHSPPGGLEGTSAFAENRTPDVEAYVDRH